MDKLVVVWKSNIEADVHYFALPYAYNSKLKGWFDEVEVLIWGASQEMFRDDPKVRKSVERLIKDGIKVVACKMCADHIGATELLEASGVEVIYTGVYLSDNQKDPEVQVITI